MEKIKEDRNEVGKRISKGPSMTATAVNKGVETEQT
jgi:hypothetical protein